MELVRKNKAEKKKNEELWRPASLGGGGLGSAFGEGYRSPDPYTTPDSGYRSPDPYSNDRTTDPRDTGETYTPPKDDGRTTDGGSTTNGSTPTGGILMQPTSSTSRSSNRKSTRPNRRDRPNVRRNVQQSVGRAVATMIVGGASISSSAGTGTAGSVSKSYTLG